MGTCTVNERRHLKWGERSGKVLYSLLFRHHYVISLLQGRTFMKFKAYELALFLKLYGKGFMRFIPTRIHGFFDYIFGALLVASPFLFYFERGPETWVPVLLGSFMILYSALTDYELAITPLVSMRNHLFFDFLGGIILALSPWMFNYANNGWVPEVIAGVLLSMVSLLTREVPSTHKMIFRHGSFR